MKMKRIIPCIVTIVFLFNIVPAYYFENISQLSFLVGATEEITEDDYIYTVSDGEATIKGYNGEAERVAIPEKLGGYKVTCIGERAFYNKNLTHIVIPEGVMVLGEYCFYACRLLESVTIPASMAIIYDGAFSYCLSVTDVYYGGTDKQWEEVTIGDENESILEAEIHFSEVTETESTEGYSEITTAKQHEITTENSTEEPTVTSEQETTAPGETKTAQCGDSIYWSLYETGDLVISGSGEMWNYNGYNSNFSPFYGETDIKNILIEEGIINIGCFSFCGCENVEYIMIPYSVKVIGKGAFYECNFLNNVYYSGTQAQWDEISVDTGNEPLLNATIHCIDGDIAIGEESTLATQEETKSPSDVTTTITENLTDTTTFGITETDSTTNSVESTAVKTESTTEKPTVLSEEIRTTIVYITNIVYTTTASTPEKKEEPVVKVKKPAKVKIKKPTSKKKKQTVVTWNKVKKANGYQLAYSTSKKFNKKLTKTKLIKKAKTTKTTLKKLKSGKKYFIRIRAYKTVNNKKVYGAYSKVMSVKVK